jgi:hypothetical protein
LLGLLYLPQGQHGRFGNKLTLNRETRHIYVAVLGDSRKDTLYIHERPSQIVVLERGTISVRRASQELRKYQKESQSRLDPETGLPAPNQYRLNERSTTTQQR